MACEVVGCIVNVIFLKPVRFEASFCKDPQVCVLPNDGDWISRRNIEFWNFMFWPENGLSSDSILW
jgi:hypothetical protein